ncbi:MAG: hypothetical protein AAFR63_00475 [Cyanobacteria bacterium J06631_6]
MSSLANGGTILLANFIFACSMTNAFIFVLGSILLVLLYIFWRQIKRQQDSRQKFDRSMDRQFLAMLGGDKKLILRLLRHARQQHPGKSYLWYHEKVIRDLERDRRC